MRTYKEHYEKCRDNYSQNSDANLYDLTIEKDTLDIDGDLLKKVSASVAKYLKEQRGINHSKWATYVNDIENVEGLEELCQSLIPQVENKIFNSHVKIENLHILENKKNVPVESSWVWHYDDCPKEFLKLAIYLNHVKEETGPMQYVRLDSGEAPVIESYRDNPKAIKGFPTPVFPKSRVPPSFVDSILSSGGVVENLTGPPGTHFVFTPNIIHRGTEPHDTAYPRLAIFMFIRPSLKKIDNYTKSALPKSANVNVKKYELD